MMGSTPDARRAGRYVATSVIPASTTDTAPYVIGSIGLTPKRNADITRASVERDTVADGNANARQPQPLAEKQLSHVRNLRTEGHPHADLARSPRCRIGYDAVNADDTDEECDARSDGQHHQRKRRLRHGARLDFLQGLHSRERQIWIDRPDRSLELANKSWCTDAS